MPGGRATPRACARARAAETTVEHRQCRNRPVESGDREVEPAPAQPGDAGARRQQCPRRGAAGQHQHFWLNQCDVAQHERQAGGDLVRGRRAVAGRSPINGIGDQHAGAVEPDRRQHAVEQLAGTADKRPSDAVLVGARRLADDHQRCGGIAVGDHGVGRGLFQRAAFESGDRRFERRRYCRRAPPIAEPIAPPLPATSAKAAGSEAATGREAVGRLGGSAAGCGATGAFVAATAAAPIAKRSTGSYPIASSAPISTYQRNRTSASPCACAACPSCSSGIPTFT